MSEVAKNKPTAMRRGLGAVAATRLYFPGLLVSVIIAVAATFLSEHYGGPVMLFALLLGMAFYFLSQEGPCAALVLNSLQNACRELRTGCRRRFQRFRRDRATSWMVPPRNTPIAA